MRKLVYVLPILFTLCIVADMTSTVLIFSQFSHLHLKEEHFLGYPGCLINLIMYPIPAFLFTYGIVRIKNHWLFCAFLGVLIGFLIPLSYIMLGAVANNISVYQIIQNQIAGR